MSLDSLHFQQVNVLVNWKKYSTAPIEKLDNSERVFLGTAKFTKFSLFGFWKLVVSEFPDVGDFM